MADYIKIEFEFLNTGQKEIAVALLTEMNYEGFEEEGDLLMAYISSTSFDPPELKAFANKYNLSFSTSEVENKNWNQVWESTFQPVIINHAIHNTPWVAIRADFHQPIKDIEHEIIITPKMSFGTGHHATTYMMIKMMNELDLTGKTILDFGTGTGILSILSEKLGAARIIAVDNDEQSIKNAAENFELNDCKKIQLIKASSAKGDHNFDIILANIIKAVILDNLSAFSKQLSSNGIILLSGLLKEDEDAILQSGVKSNLILKRKIEMEGWICLQMTR
jgi:ribosomal protein L11 methyltransferase